MAWTSIAYPGVAESKVDQVFLMKDTADSVNIKTFDYDSDLPSGVSADYIQLVGVRIQYNANGGGANERVIVIRVKDGAGDIFQEVEAKFQIPHNNQRDVSFSIRGTVWDPDEAGDPVSELAQECLPDHLYIGPGMTIDYTDASNEAVGDTIYVFATYKCFGRA